MAYLLYSFVSGLIIWFVIGWTLYRLYRAVANRVPALDRAVNGQIHSIRQGAGRGNTSLGVTYLWTLANYHARYRHATNHLPVAAFEEPRYLDAA